MNKVHTPVMLRQVVEFFDPAPGKKYIDATLGAAGHTLALLKKGADVYGIDRDQEVIDIAAQNVVDAGLRDHFTAKQSSFADALSTQGEEDYDGILFDLGVSSYQLDTPKRGFSFRYDAPLDMRMDKNLTVTAADLVNGLGKNELYELFSTLGEDRNSRKIANAIVDARKSKPIRTTSDLVRIIESVVHSTAAHIHPATRIFQALRMAVNTEREELKAALPSALSWLRQGGKLAVISFHSLEDKIVEDFMTGAQESGQLEIVNLKDGALMPTPTEVRANPRSRSAKLRLATKLRSVSL
jgi:16S rRNA (cytosine1402-N4)-methyltransferase